MWCLVGAGHWPPEDRLGSTGVASFPCPGRVPVLHGGSCWPYAAGGQGRPPGSDPSPGEQPTTGEELYFTLDYAPAGLGAHRAPLRVTPQLAVRRHNKAQIMYDTLRPKHTSFKTNSAARAVWARRSGKGSELAEEKKGVQSILVTAESGGKAKPSWLQRLWGLRLCCWAQCIWSTPPIPPGAEEEAWGPSGVHPHGQCLLRGFEARMFQTCSRPWAGGSPRRCPCLFNQGPLGPSEGCCQAVC